MRLNSILLCAVCACGNLSNEDIAFLVAIPRAGSLKVQVPAGDASQPACQFGNAGVYTNAKATGASINAGLDGILKLVDTVRGLAPTSRTPDTRTWGPFPDGGHAGC